MAVLFVARAGSIAKPKLLRLRSLYRGKSELSKMRQKVEEICGASGGSCEKKDSGGDGGRGGTVWVPHPRTGIYVPRGEEWVMKDVPGNAATFTPTCWFRNDHDLNHPNS